MIGCGHCKALAPTLEELGKSLADTKVIIAKFDATANDIPPIEVGGESKTLFDVAGFPTLFFVKADTKEVLPYESGRRLSDFKAFIKKNTSSAFFFFYFFSSKSIKKLNIVFQ